MADATPCQTPGAVFKTHIATGGFSLRVHYGRTIDLTEAEAALLETNLHNAVELVLAPLWARVREDVPEEFAGAVVHWATAVPHGLLANTPHDFHRHSTHDRSQVTCKYCLAGM